jgi:hypothetical protein
MQTLIASLRRAFSQPAFAVVAMVLFAAAAGLGGVTGYMKLSFKKLPVPLARPLLEIPSQLGPWSQASIDQTIGGELQQELGTDKYIFRDYVDTRLVSASELDPLKDRTPQERASLIGAMQIRRPQAFVRVGLTYYTGLVDTVAHIPDRCFIADGYEPTRYDIKPWTSLKDRAGDHMVRSIMFEDTTPGRASVSRNVAYFFNCNGQYTNDPIGVRKSLARLMEKYGYYLKVELQALDLPPAQAERVMDDFLVHLLPEVEKCLPDWNAVRSARPAR